MNFNDEELEDVEEVDVDEEVEETEEAKKQNEVHEEPVEEADFSSIYPEELNDERLEYIFVGLLLNNPKAISMYYFLYEDCHFANQDLLNIYSHQKQLKYLKSHV